jgi:beta-glucosidase
LSYTSFAYSDLRLPLTVVTNSDVSVRVTVQNTGSREGDEVVELYVRHSHVEGSAPIHALAGFTRVHLRPGEKKEVSFVLSPRALSLVREDGRRVEGEGKVEIFAGGGQPLAGAVANGSVVHGTVNLTGKSITLAQ